MSKITTIPDFNPSLPGSVAEAVRSLKQAVEILGGMRQGESVGSPLMFVQGSEPMITQRSALRTGDLWIDTTDDTMKYWSGEIWKPLQ